MKFDDVVQEKKKRFRSPFEEDSKKDLKSFMTEKDFISTQFYNVNRWIFDKKKKLERSFLTHYNSCDWNWN